MDKLATLMYNHKYEIEKILKKPKKYFIIETTHEYFKYTEMEKRFYVLYDIALKYRNDEEITGLIIAYKSKFEEVLPHEITKKVFEYSNSIDLIIQQEQERRRSQKSKKAKNYKRKTTIY